MKYDYYRVSDFKNDLKDEIVEATKRKKLDPCIRFASNSDNSFHVLSAYYDEHTNTFWFDIEEDGKEE